MTDKLCGSPDCRKPLVKRSNEMPARFRSRIFCSKKCAVTRGNPSTKGKPCKVEGCDRTVTTRIWLQLCDGCYARQYRTGELTPRRTARLPGRPNLDRRPLSDKLADYTPAGLPNDVCWEWTGPKNRRGYAGIFVFVNGRQRLRHVSRILLGLADGDPLVARHKCDNPPCVNPAHLEPGTVKDNSWDSIKRERWAHGERMGTAKLTDALVLKLRANPHLLEEVAREAGVINSTARSALSGKTWRHLPMDVARGA